MNALDLVREQLHQNPIFSRWLETRDWFLMFHQKSNFQSKLKNCSIKTEFSKNLLTNKWEYFSENSTVSTKWCLLTLKEQYRSNYKRRWKEISSSLSEMARGIRWIDQETVVAFVKDSTVKENGIELSFVPPISLSLSLFLYRGEC